MDVMVVPHSSAIYSHPLDVLFYANLITLCLLWHANSLTVPGTLCLSEGGQNVDKEPESGTVVQC